MLKKMILTAAAALSLCAASGAYAQHSSYNPMAPRQIYQELSDQDYSYGYSILPGNSIDGIEPANRYVGWAIDYYALDRYFLRPVAHGYAHLPQPVQDGVGNFFSNISEINNITNNLLLGQFADSATSFARFLINSTVGLLGLWDPASRMGLEKHPMKMTTVMGRAGVDQGEYLMVPFYGPASERSIHGAAADRWYTFLINEPFITAACYLIEGIHERAQLIPQEKFIDDSVDPYATMRQVWLAHEQGLVDPEAALKDTQKEGQGVDDSFMDEIDSQ
ncbi:MAG: VacJ family lipoprotein [Succinivibrio sp.]|jgi:phospholipid-binding lipoprotein MlaA|nr:VacJ family lipoprotein [Succinivibrio sp.]